MLTKEWLRKAKYALFLILQKAHNRENNEALNISFDYEQINELEIALDSKINIGFEVNHLLRLNCLQCNENWVIGRWLFFRDIVENYFIGQLVKGETVTSNQIFDLLHSLKMVYKESK
jgi:hypothetical protein